MARLTAHLVASMSDRVTGPARRAEASLTSLHRRVGLMSRMGAAMGAYVASTAAAIGPLAAGFGAYDTVKTAANFETRLTEIAKKGGLSAEALAKVKSEILGIVESGKIAMGPEEIAQAYERGIAAGIPLDKMRTFTVLSAKAADAWGMTGEEVGNAFAGFNAGMGIGFEEMERYADLINTLADAGISDEKDIVSFLDRAGATLQQFGMSREQIAAYGATLLNLKMPAEVAARAMNTLTTKLLTPKATKQSTKAFAELYGNADNFAAMLKEDANAALKDFLGKLQGLDKFRRAEILTGILGQGFSDEVSRLVAGLPELERNLKLSVTPELYAGSLDESYQKKLDTMEAKWRVFKANLEKLQIDLGNLILPAAGDFLGDMTRAANELSDAVNGIATTWKVLKDAVRGTPEVPGDFDPKGRSWLDPWGAKAQERADAQAARMMRDMANTDRSRSAPALGAYGARSMDGSTWGNALANTRNELRRMGSETPREIMQRDYRALRVDGHRAAERESMEALKRQFGEFLNPDGQSLQKGTEAADLVEEALSSFADAVLFTTAVIREATGSAVEPEDIAREAGIPIPTPSPGAPHPLPAPAPRDADRVGDQSSVDTLRTMVLKTQATGVSDVRVTNPPPRPNVSVTINMGGVHGVTDPDAIAGQVAASLESRVRDTMAGLYADSEYSVA